MYNNYVIRYNATVETAQKHSGNSNCKQGMLVAMGGSRKETKLNLERCIVTKGWVIMMSRPGT